MSTPEALLVEKLRGTASAGYDEWRVQDPQSGAYCIAYWWPDHHNPEHEARRWLETEKFKYPNGRFANYVVACVRVVPLKDRLLSEAAGTIERLTAERDALQEALTAAPSVEAAQAIGATGSPPVEAERLAFEAWMRGHCWSLCANWTGYQYLSHAEQHGDVDPRAMRTRQLWAAWRDRAALAQGKEPGNPKGLARSDADYWIRSRAAILQAIADRGLMLVSNKDGFRLMEAGKMQAQPKEPSNG